MNFIKRFILRTFYKKELNTISKAMLNANNLAMDGTKMLFSLIDSLMKNYNESNANQIVRLQDTVHLINNAVEIDTELAKRLIRIKNGEKI